MIIATGKLKNKQANALKKGHYVIDHPNMDTSEKERSIIDHYTRKTRVN